MWKLADFGLTSDANSQGFQISSKGRGTPGYRAPEFFSDINPMFNDKVDIWSVGCILFELALGKRAFDSDFAVLEHKLRGRDNLAIVLDESFSNQCKARVEKTVALILRLNPASRPSASAIFKLLSHYINSNGIGEIERLSDAEVLSAGVIRIEIYIDNRRVGHE